jgi:hypothetical protein
MVRRLERVLDRVTRRGRDNAQIVTKIRYRMLTKMVALVSCITTEAARQRLRPKLQDARAGPTQIGGGQAMRGIQQQWCTDGE